MSARKVVCSIDVIGNFSVVGPQGHAGNRAAEVLQTRAKNVLPANIYGALEVIEVQEVSRGETPKAELHPYLVFVPPRYDEESESTQDPELLHTPDWNAAANIAQNMEGKMFRWDAGQQRYRFVSDAEKKADFYRVVFAFTFAVNEDLYLEDTRPHDLDALCGAGTPGEYPKFANLVVKEGPEKVDVPEAWRPFTVCLTTTIKQEGGEKREIVESALSAQVRQRLLVTCPNLYAMSIAFPQDNPKAKVDIELRGYMPRGTIAEALAALEPGIEALNKNPNWAPLELKGLTSVREA